MAVFRRYICSNGCNYYRRKGGLCMCGSPLVQSKEWSIQYTDHNNIRRTKSIGNKKLAEEALAKVKSDLAEGKYLDIAFTKTKLETVVEEYQRLYSSKKRDSNRDAIIFRHFMGYFKGCFINNISEKEILGYREHRVSQDGSRNKKVCYATVGRELTVIKTMFKYARKQKYISVDQLDEIKGVKIDTSRKMVRYLEDEQREQLFSELSDDLRPLFRFISETGCRYSEAANLMWRFVDTKNQIISLESAKTAKAGEIQTVQLSEKAIEIIESQKKISPWVFFNPKTKKKWGSPKASFKRAAIRAGLQYDDGVFRIHDLRHDFCSRAAMNGVDIVTIADLARHKDLRSTRRYTHLNNQHLQDALKKMSVKSSQ